MPSAPSIAMRGLAGPHHHTVPVPARKSYGAPRTYPAEQACSLEKYCRIVFGTAASQKSAPHYGAHSLGA